MNRIFKTWRSIETYFLYFAALLCFLSALFLPQLADSINGLTKYQERSTISQERVKNDLEGVTLKEVVKNEAE